MSIAFLTPAGAALTAGALLPLLALVGVLRRARRARRTLSLPQPRRRRLVAPFLGLLAAGVLLGLAAAQPVLERTTPRVVRTDAEAYLVVDLSRSMLAREDPGSATRFARAQAAAVRIRTALRDIPTGLASFTDRTLPHVFPTADEDVFAAAVTQSIGIERPPPRTSFLRRATSLDSLAAIATRGFFSPTAARRVVVVLTDGETGPVTFGRLRRLFAGPPPIGAIFVRFWDETERVYTRGVAEPQYRPDLGSQAILSTLAASLDGRVYGEGDAGAASEEARGLLGQGPTHVEGVQRPPVALAPFLLAAALLPAALALGRRDR